MEKAEEVCTDRTDLHAHWISTTETLFASRSKPDGFVLEVNASTHRPRADALRLIPLAVSESADATYLFMKRE